MIEKIACNIGRKDEDQLKVIHTNGRHQDFIDLCFLLDESIDEISGNPEKRKKYVPFNQLDEIYNVVIIYINNEAVASGSFRYYDEKTAEVKRIFVKKSFRGKGLSKILMYELESKAIKAGYEKMILETGEILKASMNLYTSIGFKIVKNYGPYIDMAESICMEKEIRNSR